MKKEPLKIWVRIPAVADCGVGYYRMWLPLKMAEEKGDIKMVCQYFTWGKGGDEGKSPTPEISDEEMHKNGEWADIFYWARNDVPQYIAKGGAMTEFFRKPSVLDVDDNVQATRPHNPGYRSFHPNSPNMVWNIKGFGVYNGITLSTQDLIDFYSQYTEKDKLYLCPNSLDFEERDTIYNSDFSGSQLFQKKMGEIRIGWSGSASHWENLKHIEKPVLEILRRYPNTTFYYTGLFGDLFKDNELMAAGRIRQIGWSGLENWAKSNREMNFDIALAPLADNLFNRGKSNLRVLEYASARYPVICSPVSPYNCFKNSEVIFAKEKSEWYTAIESLVINEEKRRELAFNLYQRAKKDFNIRINYPIWISALKDIKAKYDGRK